MIRSYLMIGQSNMAGRGFLNEVEPVTDERLLMLRNCKWIRMREPVNYDRPTAGVGLVSGFGKSFIDDNKEDTAAFIPCADGGTGIDEWQKGTPLYENALFSAKMAMKISTLDGILWHQGEHDSCAELIDSYSEKFLRFYHDLMSDLGVSVPFIIGGVPLAEFSDNETLKHYATILNSKLLKIAETNDRIYYVSCKGLTCNPDMLHVNSSSRRIFGARYYKAFSERRNVLDSEIEI